MKILTTISAPGDVTVKDILVTSKKGLQLDFEEYPNEPEREHLVRYFYTHAAAGRADLLRTHQTAFPMRASASPVLAWRADA